MMTKKVQVWVQSGNDYDYDEHDVSDDYSHADIIELLGQVYGGTGFEINSVKVDGQPFNMEKDDV